MVFSLFKKKKPNVLMILIDAGARTDALAKSPFYQELKKESTLFSTMITYAPYTIGSMNALFSGMYGYRNGVNGYYKSQSFDKKNVFSLTQYMKEQGYHTEIDFGLEDVVPNQGFDKTRIFEKDNTLDFFKRHAEILTQTKDKQPFFLLLDNNKIALDCIPRVNKRYDDFSKEYFDKKKENFKDYCESLDSTGDYLKQLLQKLKDLDLYDDTLIFVFSDHGCSIGDKVGEKVYGVFLYEYTLRCFLYVIGKDIPKNKEISSVVRNIDVMPTIMEMLGIQEKEGYKKMQGESLVPLLKGKSEERIAYAETGGLGGPTPSPEIHNLFCVRDKEWKLIFNKTSKKKELYNINQDPQEENNLIGKHKEVEDRLWEEMEKHLEQFKQ